MSVELNFRAEEILGLALDDRTCRVDVSLHQTAIRREPRYQAALTVDLDLDGTSGRVDLGNCDQATVQDVTQRVDASDAGGSVRGRVLRFSAHPAHDPIRAVEGDARSRARRPPS